MGVLAGSPRIFFFFFFFFFFLHAKRGGVWGDFHPPMSRAVGGSPQTPLKVWAPQSQGVGASISM